jgi:hypothetical protein
MNQLRELGMIHLYNPQSGELEIVAHGFCFSALGTIRAEEGPGYLSREASKALAETVLAVMDQEVLRDPKMKSEYPLAESEELDFDGYCCAQLKYQGTLCGIHVAHNVARGAGSCETNSLILLNLSRIIGPADRNRTCI